MPVVCDGEGRAPKTWLRSTKGSGAVFMAIGSQPRTVSWCADQASHAEVAGLSAGGQEKNQIQGLV